MKTFGAGMTDGSSEKDPQFHFVKFVPLMGSVSTPQQDAHTRRRQRALLMEPDMTVQTEVTRPNIRTVSDLRPHMRPASGLT